MTRGPVELVRLDLSDTEVAVQLLALQRWAYEVEAGLIGSNDIPPLGETLPELQNCGETFLGALVEGRLLGAISWRIVGDAIDIHRLVVDPMHFRRRIGVTLVRAALAAEPSVTRAIVQTGADNEPAKALYLREGFEQIDEVEITPELRVARFKKQLR
jgi:ribosomal protein S18 acetylase RimI-like enzyme